MLSFLLLIILKFAKSAQITGWVYADNWFELYFNGEKIATDPLTFYPHNAVYINFTAPDTGLYSFALWAQDFANDTTGLEPRILQSGSNGGWCIGDGGFRLSLSDGTVSGSNWECLVVMEGPTNAECGNNGECISAGTKPTDCTVTYNPYPSCWNDTFCAQATTANGWVNATEYTEADIGYGRPPNADGYGYTYPDICGTDPIYATEGCLPADKFRNDQTSKFMWTSDLNFDNRIMCRYSYCVGGGTSCFATTPVPTTPSPVTPGYHCSALDAYVQVISTASNESETITSAQALFPPYTYYIPYTELTILDDTDDDPCSVTGINTDINNTIVLLFESKGSCSNHEKVYIAEQQGAVAVLIANNDGSGGVTTIIDDDSITSSIPMRSIPYQAGIELETEILAGELAKIEFGCFDDFNDFPSDVCLLDTEGERWYLDGVYQRQANWEIHDHPVWKKEGYGWILGDFYMHLIDANGDDEWYWAITREEDSWGFYNETLIAFCDATGISEPSLCPMWNLTNRTTEQSIGNYPYFNISNSLCVEDEEDFICINSNQSNLGGISGTYQLYNKATPLWYREISSCDSVIAYLYWDEGVFFLRELSTLIFTAYCFLNQSKYDNSTWETVKFRPDLCTGWYSIDNDDPAGGLLPDDTLTFDYSQCTLDECSITEAPDTLCLQKTAYFHSFLEGTYNMTDYVGSTYGRPEYVKEDPVLGPIYLWFYGELNPDDPSWILSSYNLSRATQLREAGEGIYVYGWCDADVANPVDCDASWRFYFNTWVVDDSVELVSGNCVEKTTLTPISWESHICIGLKDESLPSQSAYLNNSYFVGGYELDFLPSAGISWPEDYYGADPDMEIYVKPNNDAVDYQVVIFWDSTFGMWHIGDPWRGSTLICPYDAGYSPLDCENWYDYDLNAMSNMEFYQCTAADIITASPTSSPTKPPTWVVSAVVSPPERSSLGAGFIVIIVLAVLFGVALIGFLIWWFRCKSGTDKGQVTFEHPSEDMDGEKQTIPVQKTKQMDMSPLNNDGVDANEDDQL